MVKGELGMWCESELPALHKPVSSRRAKEDRSAYFHQSVGFKVHSLKQGHTDHYHRDRGEKEESHRPNIVITHFLHLQSSARS